ncbi:MAG: hypothetical protein M3362_18195, partial [Acidobacteriota bacterium]|nr:hypothetical protein [Acidobacteriota bacterium]
MGATFNDRCVTQTLTNSNALAAASQAKRTRIITLRHDDTTEGSRCTLTSDSQLSDYSSYVAGERFFVRVPRATLVKAHTVSAGSGFTDMRA